MCLLFLYVHIQLWLIEDILRVRAEVLFVARLVDIGCVFVCFASAIQLIPNERIHFE